LVAVSETTEDDLVLAEGASGNEFVFLVSRSGSVDDCPATALRSANWMSNRNVKYRIIRIQPRFK